MTLSSVHQLLHGYRQGHQLLAGSIRLESENADLVVRLSDLSGPLIEDDEFRPYLTGYPIRTGDLYALAKTWLDRNATRAGCVVTHTLLIPIDTWCKSQNPHSFNGLFLLPSTIDDVENYKRPLEYYESQPAETVNLKPPPDELALEFVARYFGEGVRPLVWFGEHHPEDVFWLLVFSIWPGLRRQFSCCTFSLQPRSLGRRPFDLMFAPSSAYSRFQSIPRENLINAPSERAYPRRLRLSDEPWLHDLAGAVFFGRDRRSSFAKELHELGPQMGEDPTTVRKLFLIHNLRGRIEDSPTAAIGLMDVVESLAPKDSQAIDYKREVLAIALRATAGVEDAGLALKCYALIDERLRHNAYCRLSSELTPAMSSAVASLASSYPEIALNPQELSFEPYSLSLESAFAGGIVTGLLRLAENDPEKLITLDSFPEAARAIIASEPLIALGYLRGLKMHHSEASAARNLAAWIACVTDSNARRRLRHTLLPEISGDDEAPIAEELLKSLPEEDVCYVLETLAKGTDDFSPERIWQVVAEQLVWVNPKSIREWAHQTKTWSIGTAALVAASYAGDVKGFEELLRNPLPDAYRNSQVIVAFLKRVSTPQLPYWFREYARRSTDFLVSLLALKGDTPQDVAKVLEKILGEVQEIPIAKEVTLVGKVDQFRGFEFGNSLVNLAMRSAISGFISGEINCQVCKAWQSTDWASRWMKEIETWELQSLIAKALVDDPNGLGRAWRWIAGASEALYRRSPPVLPSVIHNLASTRSQSWETAFTKSWIAAIRRASRQTPQSTYLKLCTDALKFAFDHRYYPVSGLVVETFFKVYSAVTESPVAPHETSSLFSYFDWDKGKELRKRLIDSFLNSDWPPGDLALAARDQTLLRKIFKRAMRRWNGRKYVESMLSDLAARKGQRARQMFVCLEELAKKPDFYEPWD